MTNVRSCLLILLVAQVQIHHHLKVKSSDAWDLAQAVSRIDHIVQFVTLRSVFEGGCPLNQKSETSPTTILKPC